jgi:hypothetical protein
MERKVLKKDMVIVPDGKISRMHGEMCARIIFAAHNFKLFALQRGKLEKTY